MAKITQNWVGYLDRSYEQIKESLLRRMVSNNPEITDHSETNILVIILSMFAGIGEMLNYYIDNMAREAFISSAIRFDSMVKLTRILDYRIKARAPELTEVTFTSINSSQLPVNVTSDGLIPKGTKVQTENGTIFVTVTDGIFKTGTSTLTVGVAQTEYITGEIIGLTNNTPNQVVSIGTEYQHNSILVTIDGQNYINVSTFAFSGPLDKHFIVEIDADGIAKLVFGDGNKGILPPNNKNIIANYQITLGPDGKVDANTINSILTPVVIASWAPGADGLKVNNTFGSSGGAYYENVDSIRKNAPLSIRTLSRAVTYQDYKDIAQLAPGIEQAEVHFCCGREIDIYVSPESGGLATVTLLEFTRAFMDNYKILGRVLNLKTIGLTYLFIKVKAKAKFRFQGNIVKDQIKTILLNYGKQSNRGINEIVTLSGLYGELKQLTSVEYSDIEILYAVPYANPKGLNNKQLQWQPEILVGSLVENTWEVEYSGAGLDTFRFFRNGVYAGATTFGVPFTDSSNIITLVITTVPNTTYDANDRWVFKTYPYNENIQLTDFTIPLITEEYLDITVEEQNSINVKNIPC